PGWETGADWQQVVTCVCVDAGAERWLLDPLLPPDDAAQVWDRLAARPPTAVAVLTPDHMRTTWSVLWYRGWPRRSAAIDGTTGPRSRAAGTHHPGERAAVACGRAGWGAQVSMAA